MGSASLFLAPEAAHIPPLYSMSCGPHDYFLVVFLKEAVVRPACSSTGKLTFPPTANLSGGIRFTFLAQQHQRFSPVLKPRSSSVSLNESGFARVKSHEQINRDAPLLLASPPDSVLSAASLGCVRR